MWAMNFTKMVDPRDVLFSLPTINDALPAIDVGASADNAFTIHEDDWRQFEVVSAEFRELIDAEFFDIHVIHARHSRKVGEFQAFSRMHVRNRIPSPVKNPLSWSGLLVAAGVSEKDVTPLALRDGGGVIRGGYSFRVGGLTVFGQRDSDSVYSLCFVPMGASEFGSERPEWLAKYLVKSDLFLIDWPGTSALDGQTLLKFLAQQKDGR